MNPIVSYKDFLEHMRWANDKDEILVPVILIKPSTILLLNREHHLNHLFEYYDRRTSEVQFFLPGYSHYPNYPHEALFSNCRPYNSNTIALQLRRLKTIYYSENDFIEFVETIERNAPDFRYYGNTELLFMKYVAGIDDPLGHFDFSQIFRYNISTIYHNQPDRLEFIFEAIIHCIRSANNDDQMIKKINDLFFECP